MHIIAPFMSCVVNLPLSPDQPSELDQAIAEGYVEIYVITAEGIIKHHKLRGQNRYVRLKVDRIPGYEAPKLAQTISFLPDGKIPKRFLDQIEAFFRAVMKKNGDKALEAMIWVCWNQEQGYHLIVPDQQVGGASVRYDWNAVPSGTSIVVDVHSHNTMNAFFSGTDNADDKNNISFSGVFGKLNELTPQTVWRFNYQDRKFEATIADIFELEAVEVPDEWIEQVKVAAPVVRSYPAPGTFYPSGGKGKADHLKPYQFKKTSPEAEGLVNGNRAGPHMRAQSSHSVFGNDDDDVYGGRIPLDGLWHEEGWDLLGGYSDDRFARVTEDPTEGQSLGKTNGELVKNNARNNATLEIETSSPGSDDKDGSLSLMAGHDRYDELAINHGESVADAYCLTDDCMSVLAGKDDLLEELVSDMFELSSEEGQVHIFRQLYDRLPKSAKDKIATNGL